MLHLFDKLPAVDTLPCIRDFGMSADMSVDGTAGKSQLSGDLCGAQTGNAQIVDFRFNSVVHDVFS